MWKWEFSLKLGKLLPLFQCDFSKKGFCFYLLTFWNRITNHFRINNEFHRVCMHFLFNWISVNALCRFYRKSIARKSAVFTIWIKRSDNLYNQLGITKNPCSRDGGFSIHCKCTRFMRGGDNQLFAATKI